MAAPTYFWKRREGRPRCRRAGVGRRARGQPAQCPVSAARCSPGWLFGSALGAALWTRHHPQLPREMTPRTEKKKEGGGWAERRIKALPVATFFSSSGSREILSAWTDRLVPHCLPVASSCHSDCFNPRHHSVFRKRFYSLTIWLLCPLSGLLLPRGHPDLGVGKRGSR